MRILVIEDDPDLSRQLDLALRGAGYTVELAGDGEEGHFLSDTEDYDAIVLDLGLPVLDGLTVLRRWRAAERRAPVLILTARDTWSEKVEGIDSGADDYLTKPFHMEELLARVRALIRHRGGHAAPVLTCADLTLDTRSGRVQRAGRPVELTAHELKVLGYLMHHAGRVVTRSELIEHIYHQDFDCDSNTIEVFVARLRRKLGSGRIRTHRGRGYELACDEAPR